MKIRRKYDILKYLRINYDGIACRKDCIEYAESAKQTECREAVRVRTWDGEFRKTDGKIRVGHRGPEKHRRVPRG